jgi:hypothetical protein
MVERPAARPEAERILYLIGVKLRDARIEIDERPHRAQRRSAGRG